MQTMNAEVYGSTLSSLDDFLFNLFFNFCHNLFDTCRVDAAIGYQLVQSQSADFAAYWIKSTDDDSLGCVINYDFHSGCSFQSTDVTSFTSDDASFHLVIVDMEHCNAVLYGSFGCHTLYGLDDDALCLFVCCEFRFVHNLIDVCLRVALRFICHGLNQSLASLVCTHARYLFQLAAFLFNEFLLTCLEFFFFLLKQNLLVLYACLRIVSFLLFAVQLVLALVQ